jgi:tungstate transport system substrate-binding protein
VHAPAAEKELMEKGFGLERTLVMHNDFVIVGPADDPAGIKNITKTMDAMAAIADQGAPFVSRGDDSGTNKMEISLWGKTGIEPVGDWYIQTGQGMGDTLRVASEKFAYTLTDRATYLALKDTLELEILLEGDSALLNIYHVIVVNPDKWPKTNVAGAQAFAQFLVSSEIQEFIKEFGVEQYGQPLFFPDAGKDEASLGM